ETISGVDLIFLNDAEIRMLMREPNLVRAARGLMEHGPKTIVAKQGEYGAALFAVDSFFALPAYPLETVNDPTGAGDTFAGGFLGYLESQGPDAGSDTHVLRRATAHGAPLAEFHREELGTGVRGPVHLRTARRMVPDDRRIARVHLRPGGHPGGRLPQAVRRARPARRVVRARRHARVRAACVRDRDGRRGGHRDLRRPR